MTRAASACHGCRPRRGPPLPERGPVGPAAPQRPALLPITPCRDAQSATVSPPAQAPDQQHQPDHRRPAGQQPARVEPGQVRHLPDEREHRHGQAEQPDHQRHRVRPRRRAGDGRRLVGRARRSPVVVVMLSHGAPPRSRRPPRGRGRAAGPTRTPSAPRSWFTCSSAPGPASSRSSKLTEPTPTEPLTVTSAFVRHPDLHVAGADGDLGPHRSGVGRAGRHRQVQVAQVEVDLTGRPLVLRQQRGHRGRRGPQVADLAAAPPVHRRGQHAPGQGDQQQRERDQPAAGPQQARRPAARARARPAPPRTRSAGWPA